MSSIKEFFNKDVKLATLAFIFLNIALYLFIFQFNHHVQINKFNYYNNFAHYIPDYRFEGLKFNLINSLGQADAQWYLKIASDWYPNLDSIHSSKVEDISSGASYAFFPLYPLFLLIINSIIKNTQLTAFLFSNIFLILNYLSIIYVFKKSDSLEIGVKTAFSLFMFPFSIFYRSYFAESLFLFLFIWFYYFFSRNKYIVSGILLGFLSVTKGTAALFYLPYMFYLLTYFSIKKISVIKTILCIFLSILPIFIWTVLNYLNTGDFMYFMSVRSAWTGNMNVLEQMLNNLDTITSPLSQAFHSFHSSQIDIGIVYLVGILLLFSFGKINTKLWMLGLCLFLTPLLFNDLMSYSRIQIVSLPIFYFLSKVLTTKIYIIVLVIFAIGLFSVSLYFVNWYWVG